MNINPLNQKNLKDKSLSKENGWFLEEKKKNICSKSLKLSMLQLNIAS